MKLTVTSYQKVGDFHTCFDEEGKHYNIDLMVDGSLGDMNPEDLVGRTVSISRMHAYISIGHDVTLEEQP